MVGPASAGECRRVPGLFRVRFNPRMKFSVDGTCSAFHAVVSKCRPIDHFRVSRSSFKSATRLLSHARSRISRSRRARDKFLTTDAQIDQGTIICRRKGGLSVATSRLRDAHGVSRLKPAATRDARPAGPASTNPRRGTLYDDGDYCPHRDSSERRGAGRSPFAIGSRSASRRHVYGRRAA